MSCFPLKQSGKWGPQTNRRLPVIKQKTKEKMNRRDVKLFSVIFFLSNCNHHTWFA
jgi:hypothetical protein